LLNNNIWEGNRAKTRLIHLTLNIEYQTVKILKSDGSLDAETICGTTESIVGMQVPHIVQPQKNGDYK